MALIIEDGSNVANANSYVTLTEVRAYALARGVTLSIIDSDVEVLVIKAMDYLESLRNKYQGTKTYTDQALQWPRENVYIDGILQANDSIPELLKDAECRAVMEINNEIDLLPTETGLGIKKEVVGPIEMEYFKDIGITGSVSAALNALLEPLLNPSSFILSTVRV